MATRLELLIEAVDKANAKLDAVNNTINEIAKNTKKSSDENKRGTEAMEKNWLRVSVSVMGLVKAYRLVDQEFKRIITLTRAADPVLDKSLKGWENAVNDLAVAIGNKLAPQIELVAGFWTNVLNDISGKNDKLVASQEQLISRLKDIDYQLQQMEAAKATPGGQDDWATGADQYQNTIAARTALIAQLHDLETVAAEERRNEEVNSLTLMQETYIAKEQEKVAQLRMVWSLWNDEKTQMAMAQMQKETEFYTFAIQTQQQAHQSMWATASKLRDTFTSGLSKSISTLMFDFENATDAVKNMGIALVQVLLDYMIQKTVASVLSKTLLAGEVAAATVSGAAVAAAWADAAAMVSLATLGANAIPAGAGITQTVVLARALAMPGLEAGGDILSRGSVLVGEGGPEILDLPAGARVTPLDKAGAQINLTLQVFSPIVTSEETADRFAQDLAEKVSVLIAREAER